MSPHPKQRASMAEAATNHVPATAPTAPTRSTTKASLSSPPPLTSQQEAFAEVVGRRLAAHLRRQACHVARECEPTPQTTSPPAPRHD